MCVYPQDLEPDGMRDREEESVIVRDRVSAWVYTEFIRESRGSFAFTTDRRWRHTPNQAYQHQHPHLPQGSCCCCCSCSEMKEAQPPLLMSKHDFIKQKQRDRETKRKTKERCLGVHLFQFLLQLCCLYFPGKG